MNQPTSATNGTATASGCAIHQEWIGRTAVISVSGVLDMLTSPQLETTISTAIAEGPTAIVIDLTDVDFLASAGMGVLVTARDQVDGRIGFAVVASGPATSRPLKLVGLANLVGLHATLEEARTALGA